jgi:hypothetical protein
LGKKAKHVLTLVSDGGSRAKLQVSKKTEDLVVRDILKALKGLSEDNYVYAQEHIDPGRTIGDWVSVTEELRSNICKTLIDLANKCEDLAVNVENTKTVVRPAFAGFGDWLGEHVESFWAIAGASGREAERLTHGQMLQRL